MLTVAIIISLNIISSGGSFVEQLNDFYKFDHNILLFNDPVHMLQDGIYDNGIPKTILLLNNDNNNEQSYQHIALSGGKNCILFVFTSGSSSTEEKFLNDAERQAINVISYWNVKIKIGFIVAAQVTYEDRLKFLKQIFSWSWSKLIVDVFVLHLDNDHNLVYTYSPFRSNEIIQVEPTELWMYFQDKSSNLFGHQLHVSFIYEDASIRYTKNGFESRDGKMCEYILNGLNATYRVTFRENITLGYYEKRIKNGSIDFTPRRYELLNITDPESRIYTYPVTIDSVILMVPAAKPYNQFQGFLKNFTVNNSFVSIALPIILIIVTFWIFRLLKHGEGMIFQVIVDVISLLFTLDIKKEKNSDNSNRLFILSLSFGGFFFTSGVLSVFISLLTQPIKQAEINTFDQFDKTAFKIAVPDPAYTFHLMYFSGLKGKDWKNRVEEAFKLDKFMYQMYSYNTRYAYFLTRSRTDVLIERQKHLSLSGFHIPQEYFRLSLTGYCIGPRAPFKERVDQLIHQAFQAGLYDKWNRDTYPNLIKVGYFEKFDVIEDDPEETFNILVVITYGWFLSIVVFLSEISYGYFKRYQSTVKHLCCKFFTRNGHKKTVLTKRRKLLPKC